MMDKRDFEREFHMTDYARNSSVQKKTSNKAKHITLETVQQLYKETRAKSLGIADLGCSSGPNTLSTIRDIIKAVEFAHHREIPDQPLPEFSIFLNDLPSNDFNSIFKSLPDFHTELERDTTSGDCPSVLIAANPGSFYVPPGLYDDQGKSINKGCINICSSSPEAVSKAYCSQFKEDFSMFLRVRAKEVVSTGKMVLILLGREGPNPVGRRNSFFFDLFARSIADLVAQNHFYTPSAVEIESEVYKEGSFELEKILKVDMELGNEDGISAGLMFATTVRSTQESMLAPHFGQAIMDKMFDTYARMIDEELAKEDIKPITFVVVLRRKL